MPHAIHMIGSLNGAYGVRVRWMMMDTPYCVDEVTDVSRRSKILHRLMCAFVSVRDNEWNRDRQLLAHLQSSLNCPKCSPSPATTNRIKCVLRVCICGHAFI